MLRIGKKDIFRLQITMNYLDFREMFETLKHLSRYFPQQFFLRPLVIPPLEILVEVYVEHLGHNQVMSAEEQAINNLNHSMLIRVLTPNLLQKPRLYLRIIDVTFCVLSDLDRDHLPNVLQIATHQDFAESSLPAYLLDLVAIGQLFAHNYGIGAIVLEKFRRFVDPASTDCVDSLERGELLELKLGQFVLISDLCIGWTEAIAK